MPTRSGKAGSHAASALVRATRDLARRVNGLRFAAPVHSVYNPLVYAWRPHREYLRRFGAGRRPHRSNFLANEIGLLALRKLRKQNGLVEDLPDLLPECPIECLGLRPVEPRQLAY